MRDPVPSSLTDSLRGLRVLVTGATGFLGGHVVDRLHRSGVAVHATRRSRDARTSFDTPVVWHDVDLVDRDAVARTVAAAAPNRIIHLAGLVKGSRDPSLLVPMFEANATSTVNLLDAARALDGQRVLIAGSLEEPASFGEVAASPYAVSKAAAHLYGDYYAANTDLEVVNLQIFMVYGPAQLDDLKLIPYVIRTLEEGGVPRLSSGDREVDWVYVDDVVEGMLRCCVVPEAPVVPVPLGTGVTATVRAVVEKLVDVSGRSMIPEFGSIPERANEVVKVADVDLTRRQLGWTPEIGLDEGLRRTLDWYRGRAG